MEIEKLNKQDFTSGMIPKGSPTIRFTRHGAILLNKSAVRHLGLQMKGENILSPIIIGKDKDDDSDFFIIKDSDGWALRKGTAGGAVFNNAALSRHIIDKTWERNRSHPVGAEKPLAMIFGIALKPVDDDKNKNVFALLRKRE